MRKTTEKEKGKQKSGVNIGFRGRGKYHFLGGRENMFYDRYIDPCPTT
jgi:hypothetical protein